jgi:plasmid stabilization system protein ParE
MAQLTIRFANSARAEVNDILAFIALDNPDAAAKFAAKIEKVLGRLIEFPNSGRLIPEEPKSRVRELVIPPSIRVFFRVEGDVVRVLHVMRAEQAFPPKGW